MAIDEMDLECDVDSSHSGWRHLAAAMLLRACLDANQGSLEAQEWIAGEDAVMLAGLLDLPAWPPRPEQLAGWQELTWRAGAAEPGDLPPPVVERERAHIERERGRAAGDQIGAQLLSCLHVFELTFAPGGVP